MTSKAGHTFTAGPWRASQTHPLGDWVIHAAGIPQQLAYLAASPHVDWPLEANARLIAEAGTVAHETGLTPRQLAERCEKLEALLTIAVVTHGPFGDDTRPKWWNEACAALSKAEGGANV